MEKSIHGRESQVFIQMLRAARMEAGLTQKELAERLDATQGYVSKCERGELRVGYVELRRFCHAIGVPVLDFVHRVEAAMPEHDTAAIPPGDNG